MKTREDLTWELKGAIDKLNDSWAQSKDIAEILGEVLSLSDLKEILDRFLILFGEKKWEADEDESL